MLSSSIIKLCKKSERSSLDSIESKVNKMMTLINAALWIIGFLAVIYFFGILILQKNKRSDDYKLVAGTGVISFIFIMYVLNALFG